jgi:hypothetical protein
VLPPIVPELIGLALLGVLVWFVWDSLRAREAAVAASRTACQRHDFQFLDDTVAIESIRPERDRHGGLKLRRTYGFEYSETGVSRRKGWVVVLGAEVVLLHIGAHSTLFDTAHEDV